MSFCVEKPDKLLITCGKRVDFRGMWAYPIYIYGLCAHFVHTFVWYDAKNVVKVEKKINNDLFPKIAKE